MEEPTMTDPAPRYRILYLTAALVTVAACGTQEIGPDQMVVGWMQTSPDQGGVMIVSAPTAATYEELQAQGQSDNPTLYHVFVDGKQLVFDLGGSPSPTTLGEGSFSISLGYFAAG